jgi:hypothetical protein
MKSELCTVTMCVIIEVIWEQIVAPVRQKNASAANIYLNSEVLMNIKNAVF